LIEITEGLTGITIGSDVLRAQSIDPLTSANRPTGVRVTLSFQREEALPLGAPVHIRYDFAGNGCERELQGLPRATHTVVDGAQTLHHYRIAYWIPPHAIMRFAASALANRRTGHGPGPADLREAP
jgi:hypothetical protein